MKLCSYKSRVRKKTCTVCGASNDPTYKFCRVPECHGSLVRQKTDTSYLHKNKARVKPSVHFKDIVTQNTNNLSVTCGDPDFVNPNSFSTICQTLQNMRVRAGIKRYNGKEREWLFLEVDGTIYFIAGQLIFNVFDCSHYQKSFYGSEHFKDHQ